MTGFYCRENHSHKHYTIFILYIISENTHNHNENENSSATRYAIAIPCIYIIESNYQNDWSFCELFNQLVWQGPCRTCLWCTAPSTVHNGYIGAICCHKASVLTWQHGSALVRSNTIWCLCQNQNTANGFWLWLKYSWLG